MPRSKIILTIGFLIALLPLLGFPPMWESVFQVLAGLAIIGLSVWTSLDKHLVMRARAQKRQAEREAQDNLVNEQ